MVNNSTNKRTLNIEHRNTIRKRKFKQWRSAILPIKKTKKTTITSHLKSLNIIMYLNKRNLWCYN